MSRLRKPLGMTAKELATIESKHRPLMGFSGDKQVARCIHCPFERWPCTTLRLVYEVRRLTVEQGALTL